MASTLEIKVNGEHGVEEITNNVLEIAETSSVVELVVYVDSSEYNNSFYHVCNEDWIHVIRQRNNLKLVITDNFSPDERHGVISFFHNVDEDVYINITIVQNGTYYGISVGQTTLVLKSLAENDGVEEHVIPVVCEGGRGKFGIMRPKKYELVDSDVIEDYYKLVPYDNAFEVKRDGSNVVVKNYGNVNCIYDTKYYDPDDVELTQEEYDELPDWVKEMCCVKSTFKSDSYYYLLTVYHKDMIDVTDTITITFNPQNPDSDITCDRLTPRFSTSIHGPGGGVDLSRPDFTPEEDGSLEGDTPSITCETDKVLFDSSEDTKTVHFETVPADSPIYLLSDNDFIKDYEINDHDITITVEANPFFGDRACVVTVANSDYSGVSMNLILKQEGSGVR